MTYKPQVKKNEYGGERGQAKVMLNKDKTKAKVVFVESGEEYVLSTKGFSDEVKGYLQSGEFVVRLDKDETSIIGLAPYNGMFRGKIVKFSAQKDKPPAPMTKIGSNKDQSWSYLYFVVLVEITDGECKGMQVPLFLRYNFAPADEEVKGKTVQVVAYSKDLSKSPHTVFLDEVLTVSGAWEAGPMPYKDNILPTLEKRIMRADKVFNFVMKKGFIDNVYETSSIGSNTEDDNSAEDDFNAPDAEELLDDDQEEKFD